MRRTSPFGLDRATRPVAPKLFALFALPFRCLGKPSWDSSIQFELCQHLEHYAML